VVEKGWRGDMGLEIDGSVWTIYRDPIVTPRVSEGPEAELGMLQRDGPAPGGTAGLEASTVLKAEQLGYSGGRGTGGHARGGA
jgi:hypothetical protein